MKQFKSKLLLVVIVSLFFTTSLYSVINETELEENYRNKVQKALDTIYGQNNMIALIDITLSTPKYNVKYTEQATPRLAKKKVGSTEKIHILPGYPVIKNLTPENMNSIPFNSVTTYMQPKVRKITVDLIVNKKFAKSKVAKAQKLIKKLLGLKAKDKINVSYQPFYDPSTAKPQEIVVTNESKTLMSPQNLFNFLFLLLLIAFLVVYVIFQKKAGGAGGDDKEKDDSGGGGAAPSISVNPNIELPKGGGGGGGGPSGNLKLSQSRIKQYFDFIDDDNVDNLIFVIKKENFPPDQITAIMSFIPTHLASKVLSILDIKIQAKISAGIITSQQLNRATIEKMEKVVLEQLECMVGGSEVFNGIFENVSNNDKKKILETLSKSSPNEYKLFRSNIVIYDDIKFLSDEEVKVIMSDVNIDKMAASMTGADPNTVKKIEQNLNESAKLMMGQFKKLKASALSQDDIESAQLYVLDIVKKLESENKIKLKEKIKIK